MIFHLAISGNHRKHLAIVEDAAVEAGLTLGEAITPVNEGHQVLPRRSWCESPAAPWVDRILRRIDKIGTATSLWMPDYEMTRMGAEIRSAWMQGETPLSLEVGMYMLGFPLALRQLAEDGLVPADAEHLWYGLPILTGINGYTTEVLDWARRFVDQTRTDKIMPSFKIRREGGNGISPANQRRRTFRGFSDLAGVLGIDRVWPEISCTMEREARDPLVGVSAADARAAIAGLVNAGCRHCVVWCTANDEPDAVITAGHMRAFARGAAAAIGDPEPRGGA